MRVFLYVISAILLLSCSGVQSLSTVEQVDFNQYAGTWYEIARIPNQFETNLECVTAEYVISGEKIEVINRGFNTKKGKWVTSTGKAKQAGPDGTSQLKVSFFWPFSGDYYIMNVTPDYEYALVGSPTRDYLWILSRTTSLSSSMKEKFSNQASKEGFDVSKLHWTKHNCEQD